MVEEYGLHWLIFGTADEKPLAADIMERLKTAATDLTGRTSLLELAAQNTYPPGGGASD